MGFTGTCIYNWYQNNTDSYRLFDLRIHV